MVYFRWQPSTSLQNFIHLRQSAAELLIFVQKYKMAAAAILNYNFVMRRGMKVGQMPPLNFSPSEKFYPKLQNVGKTDILTTHYVLYRKITAVCRKIVTFHFFYFFNPRHRWTLTKRYIQHALTGLTHLFNIKVKISFACLQNMK